MKDEHFPSDHDFLSDDDLNFSLEDDFDMAALDALLGESPAEAAEPPAPPEEPEKAGAATSVKNASQEEKSGPRPSILRFMARDRKTILLVSGIAIAVVIVCVILGILIAAALDPYDNRILPNTTIGGIPVGGMTKLEAYSAIKDATATTFRETAMEVSLPDGTLSLSPEDTKAKLNVWSAASAAFNLGRKGGDAQQQAAVEASQNGGNTMDLLPHLKIDQDYIRSQLEAYAAEHNVAHSELHYRLTGEQPALEEKLYNESAPTQTLELTLGTPLTELDVDAVLGDILNAYNHNQFQVSIDSIAHQTTPKEPDLDAIYQEFYIAPVNTTLDMNTYQQIPGSYGYGLNMEQARKLLSEARYGDTVQIPMEYIKPDILGDEVYFREELGYCETKHTNNEDRNTNLKLACAALDGLILQPGEEFSYNDTLGERTAEKGYKPAAAYSGVNTVNSIGGGICQVSSTLYNATLLADMEIVFRVNHGFRSGYIGIGLDATVNWGGPDFQFRNNSHFPVMIKAEVSDGLVKVKLLGTDEKDYYIKMTSGYDDDDQFIYAWSYKNKYDKETDELISKEREAYSCYMK